MPRAECFFFKKKKKKKEKEKKKRSIQGFLNWDHQTIKEGGGFY